jgi:hypothetical protein
MFFSSRPNLAPNEKAQVEYCFQSLVDCIGADRMRLPVQTLDRLVIGQSASELLKTAGDHLGHNVDQLKIVIEPEVLEKCGSGG